jgi:hypothetical protein
MAVIVFASLLAGTTVRLAGKSSCEKSDSSVCLTIESFDVSVDSDIRPMLFENSLGVGFIVAESNCFKSSPSSGKSKSSNPAEQIEVGWLLIHPFLLPKPNERTC